MRRWWIAAAVLIAAYVGYPYFTLYRIDRALLTDDKVTLQRLVDFPRIRGQLKDDLTLTVLAKARAEQEERPLIGAFGAALAGLLAPDVIDAAVDGMVTPEAVLSSPIVVERRRERKSFADFVTYAFFSAPTRFRVDLKDPEKPNSPTLTAEMELIGPWWRVVSIDLPPVRTWFGDE
ncbi:MAG: DUF2939 domain-containing protein [Methyloceanibacter sp.]|uniref:DUF2939 domain-containing protein n=1 Tax=Methyloceanibacter sp. TaxID=1965321 RepID=UPI003D6D422D